MHGWFEIPEGELRKCLLGREAWIKCADGLCRRKSSLKPLGLHKCLLKVDI